MAKFMITFNDALLTELEVEAGGFDTGSLFVTFHENAGPVAAVNVHTVRSIVRRP